MEHQSKKITDLIKANNFVAKYLDDSLSEESLVDLSLREDKLSDLKYGLIALSWQLNHEIDYETAYVKLREKSPVTQADFDLVLKELRTLFPKCNPN